MVKTQQNVDKRDDKKMIKCDKKASGLPNQHVNSQLTILGPNPFRPKSNHTCIESNEIPIAGGQIES